MATKNKPGAYDCYAAAEPDEPMFILLGRDKHAPGLVWLWAVLRELDSEDPAKVTEARETVVQMINWAAAHGKETVGLGAAALAGVLELIRSANHAVKEARNSATGMDLLRSMLTETKFGPDPGGG